jgi:uncharacterized protein YebE (UPF0316 family)
VCEKMAIDVLLQSGVFNWVLMPILIIISRIFDVSLGTIRIAFIAKGYKNIAPFIGFFEVLIWIIVIRQIFTDVTNPLWFIAYAAGFGLGTYIGIIISEKLSVGEVLVRVITVKNADTLISQLKENGYGVTVMDSHGKNSKGKIIFSVVHTSNLQEVIQIIHTNNPKAFFTIEDVRKVNEGHFKTKNKRVHAPVVFNFINQFRKGK